MKNLPGLVLKVAVLIAGLTTVAVGQTSGTIRFSGMIVEEPCNILQNRDSLTGQCIRDTKVKSVNISTKNIRSQREVRLPYSIGKMKIEPVHNSRNAAVLTVTYL